MAKRKQTTLIHPRGIREKQLLFAGPGAGKTTACLQIARAIPDAQFVVLDNDIADAWDDALATSFEDVGDVGNVDVRKWSDSWVDLMDELRAVVDDNVQLAKKDSEGAARQWLVLDSSSPTWPSVQDYYAESIFGEDSAAYFLMQRRKFEERKNEDGKVIEKGKEKKKVDTYDGWQDWTYINKCYGQFYQLLGRWKGSFILTAELSKISGEEDRETMTTFGEAGVKPVGQKRIHYMTKSCVWLNATSKGHYFSNLKDRNRDTVRDEEWEDWVEEYMIPIGGWERVEL